MSISEIPTKAPARSRESAGSVPNLALTIVAHPDLRRVGERATFPLIRGRAMELSRNAPDFSPPEKVWGQPLRDAYISRRPLLLEPASEGGVRLRLSGSGTIVVAQGQTLVEDAVFDGATLKAGVALELSERITLLMHWFTPPRETPPERHGLVGDSEDVARVRMEISRVSDLDAPVLLRGESGTGKELAARAIHASSRRKDMPLVSVNLGAIPSTLAAAELFGSLKGAFTGAVASRAGYFRAAHGGTLFLDEVGETSPEIQVMLLRAVESGEIYPVGAENPLKVDVRLIAATDSNLEARAQTGDFKAPLLHRLSSYEIWMPPLRERRDDIGRLFAHFAARDLASIDESFRITQPNSDAPPWFPARLAARLVGYRWPGNVRELRNFTRQLIIDCRGQDQLEAGPRLERLLAGPPAEAPQEDHTGPQEPQRRKPAEISEQELLAALQANQWNLAATSKQLRISRPSLYDLMRECGQVRFAEDLSGDEIERCARDCDRDVELMAAKLQVSTRALRRRMNKLGLDC